MTSAPCAPRSPTIIGAQKVVRYRSRDAAYLRILLPAHGDPGPV